MRHQVYIQQHFRRGNAASPHIGAQASEASIAYSRGYSLPRGIHLYIQRLAP